MPMERQAGGTEYSWCRAVASGTGITVLTILLSRLPEHAALDRALCRIQSRHPLLRARLQWEGRNPSLSLSPQPYISAQLVDSAETSSVLQSSDAADPFHALLEHELNRNSWQEITQTETPADLFLATVYRLPDSRSVVALRLHTGICDRVSAVCILRNVFQSYGEEVAGETPAREGQDGNEEEGKVPRAIEEMVPWEKSRKPFWAHGADLLGYSLGSMRFCNLHFHDTTSDRASRVIRLQMDRNETDRVLKVCRERGMTPSVALAAAAMKAANFSKEEPRPQVESYAVVTFVDCRAILDPPLQPDHVGFYHSAILNTLRVSSQEQVWDTAERYLNSLTNSMKCNKHLTDMGDLNFLMCKAIDHPPATPYSSLRTSLIGVFESPIIDEDKVDSLRQEIGLEDYAGCTSVHGVGPSIAFFDTIRCGQLDCACVYPWPLHSREQMEQLVVNMKRLLLATI